ncbi:MAG TPA: MurR/RpiR family transcriptional regulator [Trueperaceae bacterium]|nr:MurR/RpiR family transcriptional regulator [Trueperaceae bacterium]
MSSEEQSPEDLQARLDRAADQLTPQELRLAAHLVEQLERWGYLSSTELAAELGVHRSTVVRFAQNIGFKGYPELQESARAEYHKSFSVPRELVMSDMGGPESYTVQAVYQRELQNLQRSYHLLDIAALEATAKSLASARRVLLFGRRFSHPIALHLALVLRTMRDRVEVAPPPSGTSVDLLFDLGPEDFVLVVSLRRHSTEVQRTLRYLADAGVPVAVLTDASPGNNGPEGASVLRAHVGSTGVLDSYTALVSLSHALLTLAEAALPNAPARLAQAEKAWQHFNKD